MPNDVPTTRWRHAGHIGCALAILLASGLPARAQMIDDFLCSTFSYKCQVPPPPPAPQLAPETPVAAAPVKHARRHAKHRTAHKAASKTAPTAAPAPAAAEAK